MCEMFVIEYVRCVHVVCAVYYVCVRVCVRNTPYSVRLYHRYTVNVTSYFAYRGMHQCGGARWGGNIWQHKVCRGRMQAEVEAIPLPFTCAIPFSVLAFFFGAMH